MMLSLLLWTVKRDAGAKFGAPLFCIIIYDYFCSR